LKFFLRMWKWLLKLSIFSVQTCRGFSWLDLASLIWYISLTWPVSVCLIMSDVPCGTGLSSYSGLSRGSYDSICHWFLEDCSVVRNTVCRLLLRLCATIRVCSEFRQCFDDATDSIRNRWPYRSGFPSSPSLTDRIMNVFLKKWLFFHFIGVNFFYSKSFLLKFFNLEIMKSLRLGSKFQGYVLNSWI
jgi:hypothetical protein